MNAEEARKLSITSYVIIEQHMRDTCLSAIKNAAIYGARHVIINTQGKPDGIQQSMIAYLSTLDYDVTTSSGLTDTFKVSW